MFDLSTRSSERCIMRYAYVESSCGPLLVLMSDRGVVDVISGDSSTQMLSRAVRRFPDIGFIPDRGTHSTWVAAVTRRVEMASGDSIIPLDLGFDYQCRAAG